MATHSQESVLQVPQTATKVEVNKAYKGLIKKLRPDVNPSSQATRLLQAVRDAHAVLSDDTLRQKYNERGYAALDPQFSRYAILEKQEATSKPLAPEHGKDVLTAAWLDIVEAGLGTEKVIEAKVARICSSCSGVAPHTMVNRACSLCRGSGEIVRHSRQGIFKIVGSCPMCGGKGIQNQEWCRDCGGKGLTRCLHRFRIKIPPGVDQKSVLRLRGCGDEGKHGGRRGDVFVSFVIKPRPDIQRRGLDLVSKLNVAYLDAILGASYTVDTLRGTALLVIPSGTQHGASLELPGAGIEKINFREKGNNTDAFGSKPQKGSHFFEVAVRVPIQTGSAERDLLERLRALQ